MKWIFALAALVVGGIVGTIASSAARRVLNRPSHRERTQRLAPAAASVVFSAVLALAVVTSLSFLDKTAVDRLPVSLMNAVPRFLVALVFVLLGNAIASLAATAAGSAALRASGRPQPRVAGLARTVVMAVFVLLAIAQIGVNTKVVDTAIAGIVGCAALSLALLTGLGGRPMASEIAAGRYLHRIVRPGDTVSGDGFGGVVRTVWGATVELDVGGVIVHVPNSKLLAGNLTIKRSPASE